MRNVPNWRDRLERTGAMQVIRASPKDEIVSTRGPSRFVRLGAFPRLSYVNDAGAGIIKDAIGAKLPDWERRVDRRTACLHQANAFREKAIADPEGPRCRCCGNCSRDVTMLRVDTVPGAMLGRTQTEPE